MTMQQQQLRRLSSDNSIGQQLQLFCRCRIGLSVRGTNWCVEGENVGGSLHFILSPQILFPHFFAESCCMLWILILRTRIWSCCWSPLLLLACSRWSLVNLVILYSIFWQSHTAGFHLGSGSMQSLLHLTPSLLGAQVSLKELQGLHWYSFSSPSSHPYYHLIGIKYCWSDGKEALLQIMRHRTKDRQISLRSLARTVLV